MSKASSTEAKIAIVREFLARVFNDHHPELAIEYFTPQMTWHGGSLGTITGAENVTGLLRTFIGALPDLNAVEQDVIASDDLVAMRLVVTATQQGDLLGIPASGKPVTWDAVDIYRVNDAKQAATRAKRIAQYVEMCARGETIHPARKAKKTAAKA